MLPHFSSQNALIARAGNFAVLASLALALSQCDDGSTARIRGLKDEIQTLNHQIDDTRTQVSRLQSQIEASRSEKKKLEEDKAKAQEERETLTKELEQLKRDFETYKTHYKLSMQRRAPGFPVEDFTTSDGKAFHHVVLREITDSQINFTHEGGLMKLHYKQLPESLQSLLGFLIAAPEAPRNTKILTAKQVNSQLRQERDLNALDAENKLKDLRNQREKTYRQITVLQSDIATAKAQGKLYGKKELDLGQLKLYLNQLNNQVMQHEVELHRARTEPLKLLPEK